MSRNEWQVQTAVPTEYTTEYFLSPKAENGIVRPDIESTDTIVLGPEIDFVYVMRKDNLVTMDPIAERIANETGLDQAMVKSVLHEEYEMFFAGLADRILASMEHKRTSPDGVIQLHIFDAEGIEKKALDRCHGAVITADPLKVNADGVGLMHVSREYFMGGTFSTGLRNRPGSPSLEEQIASHREIVGSTPVTLADDDTFTGGTALKLARALQRGGLNVERAVFDIQMGDPVLLAQAGLKTDAAIRYVTHDGSDIMNISDLGDPRDYLLGASGLVVQMPNGEAGRVPYVMPFVSPAARMGLPVDAEYPFSDDVMKLNFDFFNRVASRIGREITLGQVDPHFAHYMRTMYGIPYETEMTKIVAWAGTHVREKRQDVEQIGELQKELYEQQCQNPVSPVSA